MREDRYKVLQFSTHMKMINDFLSRTSKLLTNDPVMAPTIRCLPHLSSLCGQIKDCKYSLGPLFIPQVSCSLLFQDWYLGVGASGEG